MPPDISNKLYACVKYTLQRLLADSTVCRFQSACEKNKVACACLMGKLAYINTPECQ